jgi:hypothetical protein
LNNKQLGEIEQIGTQFLLVLKKAKLISLPIYVEVQQLVDAVGQERRRRYGEGDPGYLGTTSQVKP